MIALGSFRFGHDREEREENDDFDLMMQMMKNRNTDEADSDDFADDHDDASVCLRFSRLVWELDPFSGTGAPCAGVRREAGTAGG